MDVTVHFGVPIQRDLVRSDYEYDDGNTRWYGNGGPDGDAWCGSDSPAEVNATFVATDVHGQTAEAEMPIDRW